MNLKFLKFKIAIFLILLSVFFFVFADTVFAVNYLPLVPCGQSGQAPCTRCDLFRLVDNVIHFILEGLVPPVAAVLFIVAGLMIVLAGANPAMYARGIAIFKNTFWGLVIILASWMITNTFLKSFAPAQADAPWYRLVCKEGVITPGGPAVPPSPLCSNPAGLAAQYNVPSSPTDASELSQLISCIRLKLPGENLGSIATYGGSQDNNLCNFTRGEKICGACVHAVNSCHYGGRTGTQGALSVDFGNQAIRDKIKQAACACGARQVLYESTNVHVDSRSCDDINSSAFQCP